MKELHDMLLKEGGDTLLIEELASRPLPLNNVLVSLLMVGDEARRTAKDSGNRTLIDAFKNVRDHISGDTLTPDEDPVMVHVKERARAR